MLVIRNLDASTKYYVRALASTKVGPGVYSESKGIMTNKGKCSLLLQVKLANSVVLDFSFLTKQFLSCL